MTKRIKAVVFDLDGVYFEEGTKVFIQKLKDKFQLTEDQIADVYFKSDKMQQYKRGKIDGDKFWTFAIKEWGIDTTKNEIVDLLISSYKEKEEAVITVNQLKRDRIKTAICTNNFPERLNGLDKKFGLRGKFDVVIASFEEGVTKPDPKIFTILSEKLGVKPENIVIGDDREDTVEELNKLGFIGIHCKGLKEFLDKLQDLGFRLKD